LVGTNALVSEELQVHRRVSGKGKLVIERLHNVIKKTVSVVMKNVAGPLIRLFLSEESILEN
jgi:hypothetical protein